MIAVPSLCKIISATFAIGRAIPPPGLGFRDVEGFYQAAMAASARSDVMAQLGAIQAQTLIIAGAEGVTATPHGPPRSQHGFRARNWQLWKIRAICWWLKSPKRLCKSFATFSNEK